MQLYQYWYCGAAAASFGVLLLQIESGGMYTTVYLLLRVYGCRWASKCGLIFILLLVLIM